jgi:hypothetical protein
VIIEYDPTLIPGPEAAGEMLSRTMLLMTRGVEFKVQVFPPPLSVASAKDSSATLGLVLHDTESFKA